MKSIFVFIVLSLFCYNYSIGQYSYTETTKAEEVKISTNKNAYYKTTLEGCPIEKGSGLSACTEKLMYEFLQNNLSYPQATKEAGIEGQCEVYFQISSEGKLAKTLIKDCHSSFEKPILEAFEKFNFEALSYDKKDILRLDINFTLHGM